MARPVAQHNIPHIRCELPTPEIYAVTLPIGLVILVDERVDDVHLEKFVDFLHLDYEVSGRPLVGAQITPEQNRALAVRFSMRSKRIRRESRDFSIVNEGPDKLVEPPQDELSPGPPPKYKKGITVDMEDRDLDTPPPTVEVRTDIAHTARIYDYFLGGKDNYMPDRDAAESISHAFPSIVPSARRQRSFMHRTTKFVAESGIDQFLDIGTGIPTEPNLHQIAQQVNPAAKVLYIDNDPIVQAHSAALMIGTIEGELYYLEADARNPESIVEAAIKKQLLDLTQPVSVSAIGILHFLTDEAAERLIRVLMEAVPPGSYLTLSQGSSAAAGDEDSDYAGVIASYRAAGIDIYDRNPEQIEAWCSGLEIIDPGLVFIHRWRPDDSFVGVADRDVAVIGLVARKP